MVDVSGVVAPTGAFNWVYDPTRDVIHIVTSAGVLTDYSVAARTNLFNLTLGGTPNDVDISRDGHYLLVGNSALTAGQATVTRVDLTTQGLSTINLPAVSAFTPATKSVAIGLDGTAYVGLPGSFDTFAVDAPVPIHSLLSANPRFEGSEEILGSEDHRYLLLQDTNGSNGTFRLFDTLSGGTVVITDLHAFGVSGFQNGRGDVSSAGRLVVDLTYNNLFVLDFNLRLVQDLSSQQSAGSVTGVTFNDGGHQLFVWKGQEKTVLVFDTQTWRQVGSLPVTTGTSFGYNGAPYGAMDVTAGGRALILDADTRLEILDLTRMSLTVGGDATSQTLYGAIGPDQISALGGGDTLVGGGGRDTLSGGADGDLFLFAPGDSAAVDGESDVIIDWEASDQLTFGGAAGTVGNYVEGTAGSFGAALSFAGAQIAGGVVDYVAVQVGADVVVFADSRNDNGAADDAVVLRGRTLADVSLSNIAAGLPAVPPTFQAGGAGNDTIVAAALDQFLLGGDGDDLLVGGAGANTLNGGAGLDTVSYASATGPVRVTLATTTVQAIGSGHGSDIILQVERLIGGAFGDSLTGTAGVDTLAGQGGDDSLVGGGGLDLLAGDDGADTLAGSGTLTGGAGSDVLTSTLAGTVARGGDDADRISGAGGTWLGEGGNDTLTLTSGAGSLDGGSGDDSLSGLDGADSLAGQDGDDVARGGGGADTLSGGAGADTLVGGPGRDLISGGAGADRFEIAVGDSMAAGGLDAIDVIQDWDATDSLVFAGGGVRGATYFETSATDYALAYFNANLKIQTGQANFVAVQVGSDVVVFADSNNDNGTADSAVLLTGRSLADIDQANFVAGPAERIPDPTPPTVSFAPPFPTSASGAVTGNLDILALPSNPSVVTSTPTQLSVQGPGFASTFNGFGFTYDASRSLTGGTITSASITQTAFGSSLSVNIALSTGAVRTFVDLPDETQSLLQTFLSGDDSLGGGPGADLIRGFLGRDVLVGNGGADTIWGGDGNDKIYAISPFAGSTAPATTYLRGEAGDDYIVGGGGFDDANGNQGNDTVVTGDGDDYCVGGKDDDLLFGGAGYDLVYGNLGNDTCVGGAGPDVLRGGQGNDMLYAGDGDDFLSGDRGDDTMVGGAGSDVFNSFGDAGMDRILDFAAGEGDRVRLDPGSAFSVRQAGDDVIVDVSGGAQVILANTTLATLPQGWIFVG